MSSSSAGLAHVPIGTSPVVQKMNNDYIPTAEPPKAEILNIVFKLKDSRRGKVYLPLFAKNIVRELGKDGKPVLDTIRVLDGVYSIWESEQLQLKLTDKEIAKRRRSICFVNNTALVKTNDTLALQALRLMPHNMEVEGYNKNSNFLFYEINTQKQAEIEKDKRANRRKAVKTAESQTFDAVKKHCVYLKIHLIDQYGTPKIETAIRNEYEDYADLNPDIFLKSVGSPEVEVAYLIRKAISDAKIDTSTHRGSAYWSTGGFICKIPNSEKAHEYLVAFAMMPGEESKTFKEQLQKIIT